MTGRAGVFVLVDQALGLRSIDGRDRPVLVLYAKQPVVNVRQTVSLSNRGGVVSE
jgi:hypothetical protein